MAYAYLRHHMMVPNQANNPLQPNLQIVTDEYVEQLLRLEQASGCFPSLRALAHLAMGVVTLPRRLVIDYYERDIEDGYN